MGDFVSPDVVWAVVVICVLFIVGITLLSPHLSGGMECAKCGEPFSYDHTAETAPCPKCGWVYRIRRR